MIKGFNDTIQWYDNNAETYADGLMKASPIEHVKTFVAFLPATPLVLEAGCGPGRESKLFHDLGIKTIGIDISKGLLEIAKKNNPGTEFVEANFLELPFDSETFDGVWSHASLVHLETIEEVKRALKEFYRVLKSKGILYVFVKQQQGEEKTAVVSDSLSNHDRFFRYYSIEEISDLLKDTDFEIMHATILDDDHGRKEVKWIEIVAKKGAK